MSKEISCKKCRFHKEIKTLKTEYYCTNKKILEIQECEDTMLRVNPNSFCEYGNKGEQE